MEKKLIFAMTAGLLFSLNAAAQVLPDGQWDPVGTVQLPPSALSQFGPKTPPTMNIHKGTFAIVNGNTGTSIVRFSEPGATGTLTQSVAASEMTFAATGGATTSDGLIWMTTGFASGFEKTSYLGYSYDGSNYTLYAQVTDSTSGSAQITNYAFTLGNLTSDLAAVPAIVGFFSGGYVGSSTLGVPYAAPAQDLVGSPNASNQTVVSNGIVSASSWHNGLTAAQAGLTSDGYGPIYTFKVQAVNGNQAVMVELSHEITPINQWVVSLETGNSAITN